MSTVNPNNFSTISSSQKSAASKNLQEGKLDTHRVEHYVYKIPQKQKIISEFVAKILTFISIFSETKGDFATKWVAAENAIKGNSEDENLSKKALTIIKPYVETEGDHATKLEAVKTYVNQNPQEIPIKNSEIETIFNEVMQAAPQNEVQEGPITNQIPEKGTGLSTDGPNPEMVKELQEWKKRNPGELTRGDFRLMGRKYSISEFRKAGFSLRELKNAGISANLYGSPSFSDMELKKAGYTAEDFRGAGYTAKALRVLGFGVKELQNAKYPEQELEEAGIFIKENDESKERAAQKQRLFSMINNILKAPVGGKAKIVKNMLEKEKWSFSEKRELFEMCKLIHQERTAAQNLYSLIPDSTSKDDVLKNWTIDIDLTCSKILERSGDLGQIKGKLRIFLFKIDLLQNAITEVVNKEEVAKENPKFHLYERNLISTNLKFG